MSDDHSQQDAPVALDLISSITLTHHRLTTPEYVGEVSDLLLVLARLMPPQTSLRQAVAFMLVASSDLSGRAASLAMLRRSAGFDRQGIELLGPSLGRTTRSLEALGLIRIEDSEEDARASNIKLSPKGYALLTDAMAVIS
ncbi:helix-turn-helix domain-containing protein [Brevundimonas guildfordensis]|uniref:MarR family transcriptional regulator n=1 Tax=Brevundimonas guildfordensis TaxID=2762241 RepID=A0ABR8R3U8_9CAUL|nr:hypothetical protein [Brevundimonas guildfordensis]MBD7942482.1 hypothetical protein [Brevundimonas guildfordensis]